MYRHLTDRCTWRRSISTLIALAMTLMLVPVMSASAAGHTYYVSTSGSNTAAGTSSAPLRTIQAAATKAVAGDTIYVRGGTYNERPTFAKSGTSTLPIVVQAYGSETVTISQGFQVTGSYNKISKFRITPGTRSSVAGKAQVYVSGNRNTLDRLTQVGTYGSASASYAAVNLVGSYNLVTNINFNKTGAIVASGGGQHNTFRGGTIHHTGGMLALADKANYTTFDKLDMHDPGQIDRSGNGADGINFNATHFRLSNSKLYNIFKMASAQHTDAIQWWNVADDAVIENNIIGSRRVGGLIGEQDHGHIQFETSTVGRTSQRVVIRNNVFLGTHVAYFLRGSLVQTIRGQADYWQIIGNTFYDNAELRGDMLANFRYLRVQDNIFTKTNRLAKGTGAVYDYNAYVGATKNATDGSHTIQVSSGRFVNPDMSSATAYGLNSNLRLQSTSPLIRKGVTLSSLKLDKDGKTRTAPPTLGAYDY